MMDQKNDSEKRDNSTNIQIDYNRTRTVAQETRLDICTCSFILVYLLLQPYKTAKDEIYTDNYISTVINTIFHI